jgi:glyoxylase-like metal-dependent hydrolase (beta-lactamase superfamily II)
MGHDRRLTHIYLTHAHGDHTYGIGQLLAAFPGGHAVAAAGTLASIQHLSDFNDAALGPATAIQL